MKRSIKNHLNKETVLITLVVFFAFLFIATLMNSDKGRYSVIQSSELKNAYDADEEEYDWEIEDYATDLRTVSDLEFDFNGNLWLTERDGYVKQIKGNDVLKTFELTSKVASVGESGLTGLALHPRFETNNYIYLYYTYRDSGEILNRVSRFTIEDEELKNEYAVVDNLPGGSIHNGGRMRFGPDGQLWVLTGDAGRPSYPQDLDSPAGKVLRMDEDGRPLPDNPYPDSTIYSIGHRNPQGLSWHPLTEELVINSHGESAHDEIDIVYPGSNHGWGDVKNCFSDNPKYTNPIFCSGNETWAPSGATFIGTEPWRFRYSYVFTGLRGNLLKRIGIVDGNVVEEENIIEEVYGRLRSVTVGPDKSLYVGTSNYDGRGEPKAGDDRILRVTPVLIKNE